MAKTRWCFVSILIMAFLCATSGAWTRPIDGNEALATASSWIAANAGEVRGSTEARKMAAPFATWSAEAARPLYGPSRQVIAYIVDTSPEGYVIVPADDRLPPVIAFSMNGRLSAELTPENVLVDMLIQDIPDRLRALDSLPQDNTTNTEQAWSGLAQAPPTTESALNSSPGIILLDTPEWSQEYPYNLAVRQELGASYPVGCVATAMGTVIRAFRFPAYASGTGTITVGGQARTKSFADAYNYENMPLTPADTGWSFDETKTNAVSRLLWDCGISVGMEYSSDGSGARVDRVPDALIRNFHYASAQYYKGSDLYKVRHEVRMGYPVQMAIRATTGHGHSVVCDGMLSFSENDEYFHLNMGWGDADNTNVFYSPVPGFIDANHHYLWNMLEGYVWNIRIPQDEAVLLADVTVPPGSIVSSGQAFNKTWKIRNSGHGPWGPGYKLSFVQGHKMGGADSVACHVLQPGQDWSPSVGLRAPSTPGHYVGSWQMEGPHGRFGPVVTADINVPGTPGCTNRASFVSDVTIPDGTSIGRNQGFTKTWRIRNTGTCPWGNGYKWVFVGGYQMNGPSYIEVPSVDPGQAWDPSVGLVAYSWPGTYRGYWQMQAPNGYLFGDRCWVEICVPDAMPTPPTPPSGTHIQYCAHMQDYGWDAWTMDGAVSGYSNLDMNAIAIRSPGRTISYKVKMQGADWPQWSYDGQVSGVPGGTTGMEAIQIITSIGTVRYQVWIDGIGWTDPVTDGQTAGTINQERSIRAIAVWIYDPLPPSISMISPNSGDNNASLRPVRISGSYLKPGSTVRLERSGYASINVTTTSYSGGTDIICSFDILGKAMGLWDVVVQNPDGQIGRFTNGFYISSTAGSNSLNLSLTNGDCNGDNKVSMDDFTMIGWYWGLRSTDPDWNPSVDLDGNGLIGDGDSGIYSRTSGMQGAQPFSGLAVQPTDGNYEIQGMITLSDWGGPAQDVLVEALRDGGTTVYQSHQLSGVGFTLRVPEPGQYMVKASASHWLRGQVTQVVPIGIPYIYSITPSHSLNSGNKRLIHIAGVGLASTQSIRLTRTGCADIIASFVQPVDSNNAYCAFDLEDKSQGAWNLTLSTHEGKSAVYSNALTIDASSNTNEFHLDLVNGDCNGDNVIDLADFSIMLYCWGSVPGEDAWNADADFDGDGGIGTSDFEIIRKAFHITGPQPVPSSCSHEQSYGQYAIRGRVDLEDWNGSSKSVQVEALRETGSTVYTKTVDSGANFVLFVPEPGVYTVRAKASHWLQNEARHIAAAAVPCVIGITPEAASNDGTAEVTITGAGFQPGATVMLTKHDQQAMVADNVIETSETSLTCTLNLVSRAPGKWDVVVLNPDTLSGALSQGFTVIDSVPTIKIISPTEALCYATKNATMDFAGTADDDTGVSQVTWSDDHGGGGVCSGTSEWSTGIALQPGLSHVTFTAHDAAGHSRSSTLDIFCVPGDNASISEAKALADECNTYLAGKIVTAVMGQRMYLEEPLRQAGIAFEAISLSGAVRVGSLVDVAGELVTDENGERYVHGVANVSFQTASIEPFGLINRSLGGFDWRCSASGGGQRGASGCLGLNNIGLLVRMWGRLSISDSRSFIIDDGSGHPVKCITPLGVFVDPEWSYISVTGISSCEKINDQINPVLRVRMQSDIVSCHTW